MNCVVPGDRGSLSTQNRNDGEQQDVISDLIERLLFSSSCMSVMVMRKGSLLIGLTMMMKMIIKMVMTTALMIRLPLSAPVFSTSRRSRCCRRSCGRRCRSWRSTRPGWRVRTSRPRRCWWSTRPGWRSRRSACADSRTTRTCRWRASSAGGGEWVWLECSCSETYPHPHYNVFRYYGYVCQPHYYVVLEALKLRTLETWTETKMFWTRWRRHSQSLRLYQMWKENNRYPPQWPV